MRIRCLFSLHSSCLLALVWAGVTMLVAPLNAEPTTLSQETFLRAKQATVGILEDTQDQRTPEKPGKIVVRGTGFHLRDGYVITARHAAEKHDPSTGTIIQKHVRVLTSDLNELPADLVGDSAFMDVVIYRVAEPHRSKLQAGTVFAAGDAVPGMEVFTVGYPLGWGPTMAFGRLGNTNTFLQTVETRLIQADLSACSGNSGGGLFNTQGKLSGHARHHPNRKRRDTGPLQPHDLRHSGDSRRTNCERGPRRQAAHVLQIGDSHDLGEGRNQVAHGREGCGRPGERSRHSKARHLAGHRGHGDSRCGPVEELSDRTDHSGAESRGESPPHRCRSDVYCDTWGGE